MVLLLLFGSLAVCFAVSGFLAILFRNSAEADSVLQGGLRALAHREKVFSATSSLVLLHSATSAARTGALPPYSPTKQPSLKP